MDILNEIYQTVDNIVQRRMEQSGLNNQIQAIVLGSSNGKYTISVNGAKYSVKDGVGINPQPNTPVWVCVPNNDWNKAYICAGKGTPTGGSGNVDDVYQNGNSVLGEDHIARINCATPEDIQQLQANFQAGVEAIGDACTRKGSTPASSSLEDTVAAIDAIQTGGNYITKEIREDGTYYASDDGVDAYDIVIVSKDVGQPHTVVFYGIDGETIIQTQSNVPYHGYASCTLLDGTIYNGLYFKGWNPSPTDIVRDTLCFPQFGDYIIESGEISDDWETICANGGANYPLGSYKPLVFQIPAHTFTAERTKPNGDPFTITANIPDLYLTMHMYKVAEGEDNSSSSWISSTAITFGSAIPGFNEINQPRYEGITFDWGNSAAREWLHTIVLPLLPAPIANNVKTVNKYYKGYPTYSNADLSFVEKSSLDKIWIPSVKELYTKLSTENYSNGEYWGTIPSNLADMSELNGIDYSSIYMPSYYLYLLRTGIRLNDQFGNKFLSQFDDSNKKWYAWRGDQFGFPFGFCL